MSKKALDLDIARLELAYLNHYNATQYHWVQFFSEHMADVSRALGGDLQQALILAVVGQAALEHVRNRRDRAAAQHELGGVNASRLSDITGIPRQTVRRKLDLMARQGWIAQRTDGSCRKALRPVASAGGGGPGGAAQCEHP
jgi:Fic family protein